MKRRIKSTSEGAAKLSLAQPTKPLLENEEHPLFSFRYLSMDVSVKKCDNKVFRKFTSRLKALSELTWKQINASGRHEYSLSDVDKFHVFRFDSDNHAFVGVVRGNAIYPLFIEASFGDVYNHG